MTSAADIPIIEGIEGLTLIGRGGFATVFRGHQTAFRRDVAVKVIQRSGLDAVDRQRFERECQAMGAVSDHPGIVTLYDAGFTADGRPYLVMAYVAGGTLHDRLASTGAMSWQEVAALGVRLSGALETAHRAGVLHRDIKPANVLHAEYGDQLSDFGIARIQGGHETQSGVITASVNHAAPEILDGRPPSAQADVYGLASTMYEALNGRAAFVRDDDEGILPLMHRVMSEEPADLRRRGVPDPVAGVIETAMAKEPEARHASAEAFGLALRGAQAVLGIPVTDLLVVGRGAGTLPAGDLTIDVPPRPTGTPPPSSPPADLTTDVMPPDPLDPGGPVTTTPPVATPAPPPTPVDPVRDDGDSGGPKAVLIFGGLVVLIALVVGLVVVLNNRNGGTAGTTVAPTIAPTVAPTSDAPTTVAPTTDTPTTVAPTTVPPTVAPTTVPPPVSALQQLQQYIAADAPIVDTLAESWVPQLSAKFDGLAADGIIYGPEDILANHQARRDAYNAILVDGGTYNFRTGGQQMNGWYVTIAPLSFATSDGALGWCLDQNIDRDNCIAKFISTTVIDNTTRLNP